LADIKLCRYLVAIVFIMLIGLFFFLQLIHLVSDFVWLHVK